MLRVISHLQTILASPALDSKQRGLSLHTKKVLEDFKSVTRAFITFVGEKNEGDLLQEIVYRLRKSRIDVSVGEFATDMSVVTAKADAKLGRR